MRGIVGVDGVARDDRVEVRRPPVAPSHATLVCRRRAPHDHESGPGALEAASSDSPAGCPAS